MADRHWTDEELIAKVYGAGPADGHLDACAECRARWERVSERRVEVMADLPAVAVDFAAQRRAVLAKIDAKKRTWWAAPVAAGALAAVMMGVFWPVEPVVQPEVSDAQLFVELAAVADETAPVATVRGLFDEEKLAR